MTAQQLLGLRADDWGMLRDRITDHRYGKVGLVARCFMCGGNVFITPRNGRPLFKHYKGSDPACRWYTGRPMRPDNARAAQYQGRQESVPHRLMCEQIAELVALDARHVRHSVGKYLPPSDNAHGRFPDVYVEWEGFGSFAIEFQMSGTFQTEVSQRCIHYEREGIPLLWVLCGLDTSGRLQQSFLDVIRRHRNNAFVIDTAAVVASHEQKTLVLSCFLKNGDGFDPPVLVRFDELTVPSSRLPFLEDRIVAPLLAPALKSRQSWFRLLDGWDKMSPLDVIECDHDRRADKFIAAAFSIVAAANGKEKNYASNHPNVRAMLNTLLHSGTLAPYATLLTRLIESTSARDLLNGTVGQHLRRASGAQVGEDSPEWRRLRELLPEALNPMVRDQLAYLDELPEWARPDS